MVAVATIVARRCKSSRERYAAATAAATAATEADHCQTSSIIGKGIESSGHNRENSDVSPKRTNSSAKEEGNLFARRFSKALGQLGQLGVGLRNVKKYFVEEAPSGEGGASATAESTAAKEFVSVIEDSKVELEGSIKSRRSKKAKKSKGATTTATTTTTTEGRVKFASQSTKKSPPKCHQKF